MKETKWSSTEWVELRALSLLGLNRKELLTKMNRDINSKLQKNKKNLELLIKILRTLIDQRK